MCAGGCARTHPSSELLQSIEVPAGAVQVVVVPGVVAPPGPARVSLVVRPGMFAAVPPIVDPARRTVAMERVAVISARPSVPTPVHGATIARAGIATMGGVSGSPVAAFHRRAVPSWEAEPTKRPPAGS